MNFEHPLILLLLPVAASLALYGLRQAKTSFSRLRLTFLFLSVVFLTLAAANPYWRTMPLAVVSKDANVVIILDVSQSMYCREGAVTRLDRAKKWIKTLLPQFNGGSIALIYLAGDVQIGSPLTQDTGAIRLFLNSIEPGKMGLAGTKTGPLKAALEETLGSESGLEEGIRKPIGLLFSDGEFFDSSGEFERWLNANPAFTLFTFACGNRRAPVPKYDLSGTYPNAYSEAQTGPLQALASAGRGKFFNLSEPGNETAVAKELTTGIRDVVSQGQSVPQYQPLPFVTASLLFLLSYQVLPLLSLLRSRAVIRYGTLVLIAGFISLGMSGAKEKQAEFSKALEALRQKQIEKAIDQLRRLKQEGATEEVDVALGNAYFEQGKFNMAIACYREALSRNPKNQRARWNWEVALKRKSQPGPQPPPPSPDKPPELPRESQALLKYSDQMEQQQMKALNSQNRPAEFAW